MKKMALFLILFLGSFSAYSDTYPGVTLQWYAFAGSPNGGFNSVADYCSYWQSAFYPTKTYSVTGPTCYIKNTDGSTYTNANPTYSTYLGCPSGGTISGSNCINAPVCISPTVRKLVPPYSCYTPSECAYPETDNGNGICQNHTCPSGETRHPITSLCQIKPTCGSTETYDIYSNTCKLYPLPCPGHSHANFANDACLPDAPLVCPTGQHDDGTYTCVADDAKACKSNQQYGLINGVPKCITKTNAEQAANDASTAAATLATKKANEAAALATKNAAQTALDADPTNTTKQAAFTSASNSYTTAQTETVTAQSQYTEKRSDQDSDTLKSIDQTLKGSGISTDIAPNAGTGIQTLYNSLGSDMKTDQVESFETVDTSSFMIATESCTGVSMNYKALNYEFNPCSKLALWRELFGWFCYVWTAYSIINIYVRSGEA